MHSFPKRWNISIKYRHYLIIFFVSTFTALYLHWPALKDPVRLHEDWRQSPHWLPSDQQNFQEDDPLIKYAKLNTSILINAIYRVESYFGDTIFFGKINAIAFFVLTAMVVFTTGLSFDYLEVFMHYLQVV